MSGKEPSILLVAINAKYIHSNLAVHSLRASAGAFREYVTPVEFTINMTRDQVLEGIYQKQPDLLCFSCYIWNITFVLSVAREFHKLRPKVPIWMGGPEVSFEVERFLTENTFVKGVMIGEGEKTFCELCDYYCVNVFGLEKRENGGIAGNLMDIPGLGIRLEDQSIFLTKTRAAMELSDLPFCYDKMEDYSNRIVYYESSRGCPFSCSYCLSSVDKKLRFRNMLLVKEELSFFLGQNVPQVKFVDRTFNCDHEHSMAIWRFIKEHDNGVTNFHFEISADLLTREEMDLLCSLRPGLVQLEIGVQSTNPDTIVEIHRSMKLDKVKENVAVIRRAGNINQHLDLIAGLPYEDFQHFQKSFDEIFPLWVEQLQLGFLKVLKGSYMYEHCSEYGILYHEEPPYEVLRTKWLSYEELLRIKLVEEMLEVYYNSGQYEVTMKLLGVVIRSPFSFFESLGEYYERMGYRAMNHTRLKRCEILLAFLDTEEFTRELRKQYGGEGMEYGRLTNMIQESLTFDLYARENCKTRPSWAPDLKDYKEMVRRVCTKGKLSHLEPFHYRFPKREEICLKVLPDYLPEPVLICFDYENKSVREIFTLQ